MRRYVFASLLAAAAAAVVALWWLGTALIEVTPRAVVLPAAQGENIALDAGPDRRVAGTYLAGDGRGAVLLLHGIHADRRQMLRRASFLHRQGYTVLAIDLPGQGASTAPAVTFGYGEADGVRVALDELRRRAPRQRIGVVAVSLGAAALVLCRDCGRLDAVVLESMYPTIDEAVVNRLRMRLGPAGSMLAPLLLWQLPLRLDIGLDRLRPIDHIGKLSAPLLIAAGSADAHTTPAETHRLFAAAAAPKSLWLVADAAHGDLHAFAPAEYERRIGAFLQHWLR
ncbi:alpha/beta hydrolase [Pseudoduganella armeniaca]|uniref:Alpha/beta hydrolase n=1 Tax=Pseudoduganella armeniaca TaxID=2072590 RepID=A0A2R4CEG0_9BURK|nr:alpha/beta fold hydrolase [Pseudoduganella armeniaca]AVR97942.1 alpha/beta hydrolase [Pseudoduganella armeniaca]